MQNALEGDAGFVPEPLAQKDVTSESFGERPPYRPAPWVVDFAIAVREMTRELPPEKRRSINLSFDRMLYGAAYVDSNGQRLDPVEVVKITGRVGAVRWTYQGEPCDVQEHIPLDAAFIYIQGRPDCGPLAVDRVLFDAIGLDIPTGAIVTSADLSKQPLEVQYVVRQMPEP